MRQWTVIVVVALCLACGGSPTHPDPTPTPPPSQTPPPGPTINGTLTATNGGQAVAGATVASGTISSVTDASGHFSLAFPSGTTPSRFAIAGVGLITHNGFLSPGGSRTVDLEAFVEANFDQAYFRAIARNGFEAPGELEPLRRWTRSPMLYIRTVDDTGRAILPEVLQQVATIATDVIPLYTAGRFGLAGIEQGTNTRIGQAGWITVEWTHSADYCGRAHVGVEGGTVELTYDQGGCACGSKKIRPRTVKHELGHSMGLWHTGQRVDLMSGLAVGECDRNMTARELKYLDYLYRRPVGNTDPDDDPTDAPLLRSVHIVN